MGGSDDDINTMIFEALKTESTEYVHEDKGTQVIFTEKELPEDALPIKEWANRSSSLLSDLYPVVEYIVGRGFDPSEFYWSPSAGYENRVIIPFFYNGKIVGSTARKVTDGRPKYVSDQHPHFVFNVDAQKEEQKYVFVCEGPFDALAVGGVALLTNNVAEQQARIINSLGLEVIVIPDQDEAGLELIKCAINNDWAVAFPNWDLDIKDSADAVQKYGKLFVIVDAIKTAQHGQIKIQMAMKKLEQRIKLNVEIN
jgi:hypothetical protein